MRVLARRGTLWRGTLRRGTLWRGIGKAAILAAVGMALSGTTGPSARTALAGKPAGDQDALIRQLADDAGLAPLAPPPVQGDESNAQFAAKVQLGQALFFDRLLSGNRDTSCATCHHPLFSTGDALSLPVGTGTTTNGVVGPARQLGPGRLLVPRNAPEVFNRGDVLWTTLFWDSRVRQLAGGGFLSPAGPNLPAGLDSVLAVQAMFPVTSRDEMRGSPDDVVDHGNELAAIDDANLPAMWSALMDRLLQVPGYRQLFRDAYGKTDAELDGLGFESAANAIAAFEATAFTFLDSPWDRYLAGDSQALTSRQKRGAVVFLTTGRCVECHNGPLLTDQEHYNLAVPPLGPGKAPEAPEDFGRFRETGQPGDLYRFRTPPLRNVTETGPWMHNGAYNSLRAVIKHHTNPRSGLFGYNPRRHLDQPEAAEQVLRDRRILRAIAAGADLDRIELSEREIDEIVDFLGTLTAPDLRNRLLGTIPASVPSGLGLEGAP